MIRIASQPKPATPKWHAVFLRMLPAIRQHARISFRHLGPEARDEAVAGSRLQCVLCRRQVGRVEQARPVLSQRAGPLRRQPGS